LDCAQAGGFTGRAHNNRPPDGVGLIYMNARCFVPAVGRFASADTLVPDPQNPQSYNRFSYAFNNPVKYRDPTGHCGAEAAASADDSYYVGYAEYYECAQLRTELQGMLGQQVQGIWFLWQMKAFLEGTRSLAENGFTFQEHWTDDSRRSALQEYIGYWASQVASLEASARVVEYAIILGGDAEDPIAVLSGHVVMG
ncbi:MAG: RHS repeat-associated core domain-containing protein, partial [Candidatus Promineifilaceae bacterium]